ncbi:MAG: hypothetical protein AAGG80_07290 [Pseudomonadota bacterium]
MLNSLLSSTSNLFSNKKSLSSREIEIAEIYRQCSFHLIHLLESIELESKEFAALVNQAIENAKKVEGSNVISINSFQLQSPENFNLKNEVSKILFETESKIYRSKFKAHFLILLILEMIKFCDKNHAGNNGSKKENLTQLHNGFLIPNSKFENLFGFCNQINYTDIDNFLTQFQTIISAAEQQEMEEKVVAQFTNY